MELKDIIKAHAAKYPKMQPCDAVKLIYQNEFGGGHLISDPERSLKRLKNELKDVKGTGEALFEPIGNGTSRLYLSSKEARELSPELINDVFVSSARIHLGSRSSFRSKLELLSSEFESFGFGFSKEALDAYLKDYEAEGYPMVSHSDAYREAYAPAYRVVEDSLCAALQPEYAWDSRIVFVEAADHRIWCKQYIPRDRKAEKLPLVILSHGMDDDYTACEAYALDLVTKGIACCCLEFYGGGGKMSGGSTRDMSIKTETEELKTVLKAAAGWDFVDPERIALFGESMGAVASAFTAAELPEMVRALILCYPAFVIFDDIHNMFGSLGEVPEACRYRWLDAGQIFYRDIWDIDPYRKSAAYTRRTLILHGNADNTVPISYSEKAAESYPDNDYFVINGAKHGFKGKAFEKAVQYITEYLSSVMI